MYGPVTAFAFALAQYFLNKVTVFGVTGPGMPNHDLQVSPDIKNSVAMRLLVLDVVNSSLAGATN